MGYCVHRVPLRSAKFLFFVFKRIFGTFYLPNKVPFPRLSLSSRMVEGQGMDWLQYRISMTSLYNSNTLQSFRLFWTIVK